MKVKRESVPGIFFAAKVWIFYFKQRSGENVESDLKEKKFSMEIFEPYNKENQRRWRAKSYYSQAQSIDNVLFFGAKPRLLRRRDRVSGWQGQTLGPRWRVLYTGFLFNR